MEDLSPRGAETAAAEWVNQVRPGPRAGMDREPEDLGSDFDTDDGEPPLGDLVKRGLRWSFAGVTAIRAGTFVSGLLMARILNPKDFGIYAVGVAALLVIASVNDVGIEPTLVRWPGDLDAVAPTAMTVVLAATSLMFVGFWFAAPAFANLLNSSEATGVVRVMLAALVINGAFTVHSALNTRAFRQHVRVIGELAGMFVTIGLMVGLALAGLGPYSLAIGHIAGNLVIGLVLWANAPARYHPGFKLDAAKQLIRAGLPLAGAGLLAAAVLNVDYLIVGATLGATSLGLYLLAWNLSSWPVSLVSVAVNRVSVPSFARMQHDHDRLVDAFRRSMRALLAVTLPFCALLAALSLPTVTFLYGDSWTGAATPLHFLAAVAGVRIATLLGNDMLVGTGRGRVMFYLQGLWLVALVPALAVGADAGGLMGVGIAYLLVVVAVAVPGYLVALRKCGFPLRALGIAAARPLVGAIVAGCAAAAVSTLFERSIVQLIVGGVVGLGVYLALIGPMWFSSLRDRRRPAPVAGS